MLRLSDKELDNEIFKEIAKGLTGRGDVKDLRKLLDEWAKRRWQGKGSGRNHEPIH